MDRHINAPLTDEDALSLKAGDYVYITGTIYTARDAAHKRMYDSLMAGVSGCIYGSCKKYKISCTKIEKSLFFKWYCEIFIHALISSLFKIYLMQHFLSSLRL